MLEEKKHPNEKLCKKKHTVKYKLKYKHGLERKKKKKSMVTYFKVAHAAP